MTTTKTTTNRSNPRTTAAARAGRPLRTCGLVSLLVATLASAGPILLPPAMVWAKASSGRYVVSSDGDAVSDAHTKLQWQRKAVAGPQTWANAKTYCDGLELSGKSDWRLPGVRELSSIVDKKETTGASIDKVAFPDTQVASFWSATPRAGPAGYAWVVDFTLGLANAIVVGSTCQVRCVRGG